MHTLSYPLALTLIELLVALGILVVLVIAGVTIYVKATELRGAAKKANDAAAANPGASSGTVPITSADLPRDVATNLETQLTAPITYELEWRRREDGKLEYRFKLTGRVAGGVTRQTVYSDWIVL